MLRNASRPTLRLSLPALSLLLLLLGACEPPPAPPPPSAEVPVRTEVVEAETFRPALRLLGQVEPASRIALRPDVGGEIRYPERFAGGLRTGEQVRRGETLFFVADPSRRLALEEARLQAELAESELERARLGVQGGFLPESDLKRAEIDARLARERLEGAAADVERLEVRAPVSGVLRVDQRLAPGSRVGTATVVAWITAEGDLVVEAWVAASDLERLAAALSEGAGPGGGVPAELLERGSGDGGATLVGRGRLAELAREVGAGGVARAVIDVTEDLGMPQVGDGVEVELLLPPREDAVTVPERALVVHGSVATVYVLDPLEHGYRARSRQVIPGARHGGRVEILDGLSPGETIAVEGAELLADGMTAVDAAGDSEADRAEGRAEDRAESRAGDAG